jgi:AcrR family transcriptional regulator
VSASDSGVELAWPRAALRSLRPGEVRTIQRARILAAAGEIAGEHGQAATTISRVIARAGVSRRTFYELFEDRDACLLGVFEDALARAAAELASAYRSHASWVNRVRAALLVLLELAEDEPEIARICIVQALTSDDPRVLAHRRAALGRIGAALEQGRPGSRANGPAPPVAAEAVAGGVLSILLARLQHASRRPVIELLGSLTAVVVLPYAGPAAARRELGRPAPQRSAPDRAPAPRGAADPLASLNMRITYRTVRVLAAIAARPGLSNREIANDSGITDPGQVSRLLSRLRGRGLVENRGAGRPGAGRNAWVLTATGERVTRALAVRPWVPL